MTYNYSPFISNLSRIFNEFFRGPKAGLAVQRAKLLKKVHKPPLRANAINLELNEFNASIWVPWSPSDPKSWYALIEVFKFIGYV